MKKIREILKLMRVKHYLKNGLIILPLFFSGFLTENTKIINIIVGFLLFSLSTSIVYIINDIKDVEKDRIHPIKKNRPLAAKTLTINFGIFLIFLLIIGVSLLNFLYFKTNISIIYIIIYIVMNIAYSLYLKNIVLVDVAIVALGFLLRVYYGASVISVSVSNWLFLTILFVAFYMALGKRRNEINKQTKNTREVLKYYTKEFLDKNMYMCLGSAIVFYSLWCVDISLNTSNLIVWSVPLVTIILMRYSLIVEKDSHGDPVDVLLNDFPLLILSAVYLITIIMVFYF